MTLNDFIADSERQREAWKYTSLRSLRDGIFAPAAPAQLAAAALPMPLDANGQRLVFVNGVLHNALSKFKELPSDCISGDATQGYSLTIPAQTCLATVPLELLFIVTHAAEAQQSTARLHIALGANARVTLLERHCGGRAGSAHVAMADCTIDLAEQAKLVHLKFQELAVTDYHLASINAKLGKGAYYDQFCFTTGAALSRNSITIALTAPEAQARLHGLYLLRGAQHCDTTTLIRHDAPHTTSEEHYRGVLDGKARGVFQGKIIVAPDAQKSDGQQMSRALLLSDQAEANHKPELEIYADDVKCSHGATVGQLDETALFYLRSRGIASAAARAMLMSAFTAELIEAVVAESGRAYVAQQALKWHEGGL